jgi:general secretion pathway protein B
VSYILDALDKAEQDRQHTRAPNLKTAHTAVIKPNGIPRVLWTAVLILAALVVVLILYQGRGLFWQQQRDQILVKTGARTVTPIDLVSSAPAEDSDKDSLAPADIEAPVQSPSIPARSQAELIEPEIADESYSARTAYTDVLNINDLPLSVQRQIPDLSFSTHIFASDAAWRMVGINGNSRREGDKIDNNLVLQEITEQGVILGFKGYSFSMGVVKNWSSE